LNDIKMLTARDLFLDVSPLRFKSIMQTYAERILIKSTSLMLNKNNGVKSFK